MAKQIRLEFISEGFKEILSSQGVKEAVEDAAKKVAAKAQQNLTGYGNAKVTMTYLRNYNGGRHAAYVHCPAFEESEHKALSKAVGK